MLRQGPISWSRVTQVMSEERIGRRIPRGEGRHGTAAHCRAEALGVLDELGSERSQAWLLCVGS